MVLQLIHPTHRNNKYDLEVGPGRPKFQAPGNGQRKGLPSPVAPIRFIHYSTDHVCHSMPSFQIQLLLSCEVCELVATNTLVRQLSAPMAMH